ncbi:MAG: 30S ribosomal protein S8 [Candidatus Campbellbacteria bacterium]|nr:30S ribosomal protein S8 [Candidatus Campbellbacteria bacterium]
MTTDPLANFITALQNAARVGVETVSVPHSRLKDAVAVVLKKEGYLANVDHKGKKTNKIEATLAFDENGDALIHGVKRLSKPSRRVYIGSTEVYPVKNGYGHLILSTPEGVMTGQQARKAKVGGEVLFMIW